jgi:hypothetical protein
MPAVSKRDFNVRSDHTSVILWWLHVRWSAFAAFRRNLHQSSRAFAARCSGGRMSHRWRQFIALSLALNGL